MDEFKKAQTKDVAIGGYKCACCCDVGGKNKPIRKRELHKRARTRLKCRLIVQIKEESGDNV